MRETETYITFDNEQVFEYSRDFDVCQLVEEVDGYTKESFVYDVGKILLPNEKMVMCNSSKKPLELDTFEYAFKYRGNEEYKKITFIDTTPPTFNKIKKEYVVEKGNEYFNLNNIISVSDNYTNDFELFFNGEYDINKVGKYPMEVVVFDSSFNKATYNFTIIIKDSVAEAEKNNNSSSGNNNSNGSSNGSSGTPSNPSSGNSGSSGSGSSNNGGSSSGSKKPPKTFSIDDYDSFDECLNVCNQYIKGNTGMCTPYKEGDIYKGYKASFD